MCLFLSILLLIFPWCIFVGLAVFCLKANGLSRKCRSRGICTFPGCLRCNRNKQELSLGVERFKTIYKDNTSFVRIKRALDASNGDSELFLKLEFLNARPIWSISQLTSAIQADLQKLNSSADVIISECQEALKCAYLWQRNDERSNFWYIFSLINQGAWQDKQCRVCKELVRVLHSMDYIMTDCQLGNVFISMLPRNSEIGEHRGLTNARLRVHFGIEVPEDKDTCYMIVNNEKFHWTQRGFNVFDDSYLHSVSSKNCKEDRIVLIFDIWHPELSKLEQQCLTKIFPAIYT